MPNSSTPSLTGRETGVSAAGLPFFHAKENTWGVNKLHGTSQTNPASTKMGAETLTTSKSGGQRLLSARLIFSFISAYQRYPGIRCSMVETQGQLMPNTRIN